MPTEQELLSWLDKCPICGSTIRLEVGLTMSIKTCGKEHGFFRIADGTIIFELNPKAEA